MARWPAAVLAVVLAFSGEAGAGPPTETLTAVVTTVNRLLEDPTLRERPEDLHTAIRAVVADRFEARLAARLVLGRDWDIRTPAEREEFVQLFKELVESAYISRIAARATVRPGLAVRYIDEVIEGDRATVTATIESRDGREVPLEHRMIRRGDRWMVYDVSIEGVDLVRGGVVPEPRTDVALRTVPELGPAVPPATGPAPGSFWIQMGAFTNKVAGELASRLLEESLPLAIDAVKTPTGLRGQLLLRVRIGPFTDRAEAAAKLQTLQSHGYKPVIATDRD